MKEALKNFLKSLQLVFDLVSDRVYSTPAPAKAGYPLLSVQGPLSTDSEYDLQGIDGVAREEWQIDCWALTDTESVALREAVRRGISGYVGKMDSFTILSSLYMGCAEGGEYKEDNSGRYLYRQIIRVRISRTEAGIDRTKVEEE